MARDGPSRDFGDYALESEVLFHTDTQSTEQAERCGVALSFFGSPERILVALSAGVRTRHASFPLRGSRFAPP